MAILYHLPEEIWPVYPVYCRRMVPECHTCKLYPHLKLCQFMKNVSLSSRTFRLDSQSNNIIRRVSASYKLSEKDFLKIFWIELSGIIFIPLIYLKAKKYCLMNLGWKTSSFLKPSEDLLLESFESLLHCILSSLESASNNKSECVTDKLLNLSRVAIRN